MGYAVYLPPARKPLRIVGLVSARFQPTRSAPPGVLPDAHIRWGEPSEFLTEFRDKAGRPGVRWEEEQQPQDRVLTEEARTWSDIAFTNPEDDSQSLILRRTEAIAFEEPDSGFRTRGFWSEDNPSGWKRGAQTTWTFGTSYERTTPVPGYLFNERDEEFEPWHIDPLTTVVEVGWPQDDFILISVMVSPRVSCEFAMEVKHPPETSIYTPGFEFGELPSDDPNTPDVDESQPPEGALPFMERTIQQTALDQDRQVAGIAPAPQGMDPLQRFGPEGPENVGDTNDTGESTFQAGNNILRLQIFINSEWWLQFRPRQPPHGSGGDERIWVKQPPGGELVIPGWMGSGFGKKFLSYVTPQGSEPHHIPDKQEDGEEYAINPGEDFEITEQWKLDREVENYTMTGDGPSVGGFTMGHDVFDTAYRNFAFFRRWAGEAPKPYDDDPFVFALFVVNVGLLRKVFGEEISPEKDLEISVLAGAAGDVRTDQGLEEGEGSFSSSSGKLRWAWYKGSQREAVEAYLSSLSDDGGVLDPERDSKPSKDEVWEALFAQDGLRTFSDGDFPHTDERIEGELKVQKSFRVHWPEKSLIELE